jgi:endo-1,3(4)-beta-glucanase
LVTPTWQRGKSLTHPLSLPQPTNIPSRGNLQLSILSRSLKSYYLYTQDNTVQPAQFIGNRVAGILFENKIDHTTYFGTNIEYIQGIHMIPLLPSTPLIRSAEFVTQEWNEYFSNGRVDQIAGGWRGILYANYATINPKGAWNFFADANFDPSWLDGGASLTWYLAYCAGEFLPMTLLCCGWISNWL